ncbi:transcription antitermination factor NusB [Marinospirillum alkaliphilum]|uniref:Transcription antitermination protein NusB n=1 Tax=Marinospirillum alkaliphilum DSM 21637 TaxID=1122209 RepID=A0A1K1V3Q6_9GAMM|nr:transcription antitermination factor NusB [Marinospirillum alkaliphilum]SFX19793.1 NusB antitermination factor [Marinospirillum alkaliphilum DSM 21637]
MASGKNGKPSRSQARSAARQLTLQALYQWQVSGNAMHQVEAYIRAALPDDGLEPHEDIAAVLKTADLAYFHEMAQAVARQQTELDESFAPFLDRRVNELDPIELAILRLGSYELTQRLDVPYRVVINEAVELAKRFGGTDSHKYVNGILDKLAQRARAAEIQARRSSQG